MFDPLVTPASALMIQDVATESQSTDPPEKPAAQEDLPLALPDVSGEITVAKLLSEIERQKTAIGGDEQMDEMQKAERLEMLASAQGALLKTATFKLKRDEFQKQLADYPAALQTPGTGTCRTTPASGCQRSHGLDGCCVGRGIATTATRTSRAGKIACRSGKGKHRTQPAHYGDT